MATLAGQRAQFTWSLNQYNLAEDAETRAKFAKRMAKYIGTAPANGFTVDEVTQGQIYPASEVEQYIRNPGADDEDPGITEEQAKTFNVVLEKRCYTAIIQIEHVSRIRLGSRNVQSYLRHSSR